MKSLTVWHGHSTQPSLPAGTARKVNGSLPRGKRSRLIISQAKKNRAFPTGNALLYISLSYVDFSGCVRVGAPCFCFVLNLLTLDLLSRFADILPARRSRSVRHAWQYKIFDVNIVGFAVDKLISMQTIFHDIIVGLDIVDYSLEVDKKCGGKCVKNNMQSSTVKLNKKGKTNDNVLICLQICNG